MSMHLDSGDQSHYTIRSHPLFGPLLSVSIHAEIQAQISQLVVLFALRSTAASVSCDFPVCPMVHLTPNAEWTVKLSIISLERGPITELQMLARVSQSARMAPNPGLIFEPKSTSNPKLISFTKSVCKQQGPYGPCARAKPCRVRKCACRSCVSCKVPNLMRMV